MNTLKVIFAAVVIFGAGMMTGAVWSRMARPASAAAAHAGSGQHPQQLLPLEHLRRLELMGRVQKELKLTPEQRQQIEKIIGDGQEHVRQLWEEVSPDIHDELRKVQQQLCAELTPAQKQRFNQLMRQHWRHPAPTNAPAPKPAAR